MAQKLEVKLVNEKEWSTLVKSSPRYEYVDEDNMGFADPRVGKAYVRQTYWPELNRYLLAHEFEHLLEEKGTDEDAHGVRHKRGFARNYLAYLAAPFTLGSSLLVGSQKQHPAVGSVGGPLNQAANAVYNTVPAAVGGAIGGFGGPAGAAAGGAIGSRIGSFATGSQNAGRNALLSAGLAGVGQGLTGGFSGKGFQSSPTPRLSTGSLQPTGAANTTGIAGRTALGQGQYTGMGGLYSTPAGLNVPIGVDELSQLSQAGYGGRISASPLALGGPFFSQAQGGVSSGSSGGGGPQPPGSSGGSFWDKLLGHGATAASGTQPATQATGLSRFGLGANVLGPAALGAGIAGFGQIGGPKRPEIPEFGQLPSVQRFGQESQNQLGSLMSRFQGLPNQALPEALASPIRRNYELQRRQYTSQFKAFRPGADIATDTEYARGINDINQRENEAVAQSQLSFQGEQRQNLIGELGVTEDQMGVLGTLAQADIDTIRLRTGLSAEDAAQFKQTFGNLGSAIAGGGIMSQFGVR